MTNRQATTAEVLAVATAERQGREVTARDVWVAAAVVAELRAGSVEVNELRDWRELGA